MNNINEKLLLAINKKKHLKIIVDLVEKGADINSYPIPDSLHEERVHFDSPLVVAVRNNNKAVVEFFIQKGVNVNIETYNKATPLETVVKYQHYEILELLIRHGATPRTCIETLDDKEFWNKVLAAQIIDIFIKYFGVDKEYCYNKTLLHFAVWTNNLEAVIFLIRNGAKIDAEDFYGYTPLHEIAEVTDYRILLALINSGVNVNHKNIDDETPLHLWAVGSSNTLLASILINKGADINARDSCGNTPLHLATFNPSNRALLYLLEIGADQTIINKNNKTAFDLLNENFEKVTELFKA